MKFIEFISMKWDEESDTDVETQVLIGLDKITSVSNKKHYRNINGQRVAVTEPYIALEADDNMYVLNYTYEELKRILETGGNIIKTGVGR